MKANQTKTKPKPKPKPKPRRRAKLKSKKHWRNFTFRWHVWIANYYTARGVAGEVGDEGGSVTESVIHIARGQPGSGSARGSQRQRSAAQRKQTSRSYSVRITINAHRFILISRPPPCTASLSLCLFHTLSLFLFLCRLWYSLYSAAFSDMKLCLWPARPLPARCHLNCTSTIHKLQLPQLLLYSLYPVMGAQEWDTVIRRQREQTREELPRSNFILLNDVNNFIDWK